MRTRAPHRLGKLDRQRTHTAGTTVDQNGLRYGKLGTGHQSLPDRASHQRQTGSFQMSEVVRLAATSSTSATCCSA